MPTSCRACSRRSSFAARDATGADLPDTTVYIDDVLVVTRLDDGKPHDVDPGKHTVKFSNGGHDSVTVVIGAGEQGRTVAATFDARRRALQAARPAAVQAGRGRAARSAARADDHAPERREAS